MTLLPEAANRLRELRVSFGFTQAQLAQKAGISRTAVTAIEKDQLVPSVKAALAIANVLGTSVEFIFGAVQESRPLSWAWAPPADPWRGHLAEVSGQTWLYPVEFTERLSFSHDLSGISEKLSEASLSASSISEIARRTLVVATCDPAANLMASLYEQQTGFRMLVIPRSSREALDLWQQGKVHVAGVHFAGNVKGETNSDYVRSFTSQPALLLRASDWEEGIVSAAGSSLRSISAAVRAKIRWVGRNPGSAARACQGQLLGAKRSYSVVVNDHRGVVEMVRAGVAEAGVCLKLCSAEAGLPFLMVQQVPYDLCYHQALQDDPRIKALQRLLCSSEYRQIVGGLPGYSLDHAGESELLLPVE